MNRSYHIYSQGRAVPFYLFLSVISSLDFSSFSLLLLHIRCPQPGSISNHPTIHIYIINFLYFHCLHHLIYGIQQGDLKEVGETLLDYLSHQICKSQQIILNTFYKSYYILERYLNICIEHSYKHL